MCAHIFFSVVSALTICQDRKKNSCKININNTAIDLTMHMQFFKNNCDDVILTLPLLLYEKKNYYVFSILSCI